MITTTLGTAIGKIVKSNTHVDYVCQIYNANELATSPQPSDYCFGGFVAIQLDTASSVLTGGGQLVGVIYNTLLMNPEFGNLGPRLSQRDELEVFTPDYLAETATLVGILALGWIDPEGRCQQGVPMLAATVNNPVYCLPEAEVRHFHQDAAGRLSLRYMPLLLGQNSPLLMPLMLNVVDRLELHFPEQRSQLKLMRNNLAWKSVVRPVG